MNKNLACHYSVLRFCPYPETDEFVNIGIVLSCPATGFLDFRRTRTRLARVSDFFPELDAALFKAVVNTADAHLARHRQTTHSSDQVLADFAVKQHRDAFQHLVRARESILFYSEPRVVLSNDPATTLKELFQAYVERSFAKTAEYKEGVMGQRLQRLLREHKLMDAFQSDARVGDQNYHLTFTLASQVSVSGKAPDRAIRALDLDKEEPTDVIQHADSWLAGIRRLREFHTQPARMLFVLRPPAVLDSPSGEAYRRVLKDYAAYDIPVITETQSEEVLEFAKL
jgi:hypothetical protein